MTSSTAVRIPHVVRGEVVAGTAVEPAGAGGPRHATPALDLDLDLDLDRLVLPRSEPFPAVDTPVAEMIDLLVAVGDHLRDDPSGLLSEALAGPAATSPYDTRILENSFADLWQLFTAPRPWAQVDDELGGPDVVDGWRELCGRHGPIGSVRAFPTRLVHVLAGNAPGVAAMSVVRGALMKGYHLLKMASNDLFSATAVRRALDAVAPGHPTTRSFSAVYWRGGDPDVERAQFRPQFFDKIVARGGRAAIRSDEPVDFRPPSRAVNVVGVRTLEDATRHVDVATRTVSVYPPARRAGLRDALASAGAQRITDLGGASTLVPGLAHDGLLPLHRLVRWVNDEARGSSA